MSRPQLVQGVDYYYEKGKMVLTEYYLRKRGTCCATGCRHCPYRNKQTGQQTVEKPQGRS
jgi:hypothetical protein